MSRWFLSGNSTVLTGRAVILVLVSTYLLSCSVSDGLMSVPSDNYNLASKVVKCAGTTDVAVKVLGKNA